MIAAIAPPADKPATNDRLTAMPNSEMSSRDPGDDGRLTSSRI
jgi:hypothetical protein